MKIIRSIAFICALIPIYSTSFCGESAIPFSFEVLQNGQPVLGCARPSCFGRSLDGEAVSRNAQFYSTRKVSDGFVRKSVDKIRNVPQIDFKFKAQIAECESTFDSDSCSRDDQWVGGISPGGHDSRDPLLLQCCSYNALKNSTDRGIASVHTGEIVIGGEVINNARQYAFDYIADIKKVIKKRESALYEVTMKRFPCSPVPEEFSVKVADSVAAEMESQFFLPGRIQTTKGGGIIVVQAPIAPGAGAVVQTPGMMPIQNAVPGQWVTNVNVPQPIVGRR